VAINWFGEKFLILRSWLLLTVKHVILIAQSWLIAYEVEGTGDCL